MKEEWLKDSEVIFRQNKFSLSIKIFFFKFMTFTYIDTFLYSMNNYDDFVCFSLL